MGVVDHKGRLRKGSRAAGLCFGEEPGTSFGR
jgi:hypothetical protein